MSHVLPWYVTGPLIGLVVPLLLFFVGKPFGLSSNLRHLCAACLPSRGVDFLRYDWRGESWNLFMMAGIAVGGFLSVTALGHDVSTALPSWATTGPGMIVLALAGVLVGFGTRYAAGCTSGHAIMGVATLQWPSMVAMLCFFAAGVATRFLLMPHLTLWLEGAS